MLKTTSVSVSPVVIGEVMSLLSSGIPEDKRLIEAEPWIQTVIGQARAFIDRFQVLPFFHRERSHEFTGIALMHNDTQKIAARFSFVLQYFPTESELGIFSLSEVPIDEMYSVRKVIAESELPEFQVDLPSHYYQRQ